MSDGLDALVAELESVAARLRAEDVEPSEAAELVEHCAELAARIGSELDAESRAASEASTQPPDQERLL
jgi:hypothetical protein